MFDLIKTFARGWSAQGQAPQFSPDSLLLYTNGVLSFLEDGHKRYALRNAVCADEDEYLWFEFSYDALALSMASALARAHADGNDAKHRYVNAALSAMATAIGEKKPEYLIGQMVSNTAELNHLYSVWNQAGGDCSRRDFILTPFPYGKMLDTVYPLRTLEIIKIIFDCSEQQLEPAEYVKTFTRRCSSHFMSHVTHEPTVKKEVELAGPIVRLFYSLTPKE